MLWEGVHAEIGSDEQVKETWAKGPPKKISKNKKERGVDSKPRVL